MRIDFKGKKLGAVGRWPCSSGRVSSKCGPWDTPYKKTSLLQSGNGVLNNQRGKSVKKSLQTERK